MKKMLKSLTANQEEQLESIVKKVVDRFAPAQIYCFGCRVNYSCRYSCFTDSGKNEECEFDLLVITRSSIQKENEIQDFISTEYKSGIVTVVNYCSDILVASLAIGQRFITTIIETGGMLYISEGLEPLQKTHNARIIDKDQTKNNFERSLKNAWVL